jgi:hypothetical protein
LGRKDRRHRPPPATAGNDGSNQFPWYGARPWPRGDHLQRDQLVPVKIIGGLIAAVIAVMVLVSLLTS